MGWTTPVPIMLEERVAYLESNVKEHDYAWQELRARMLHLRQTLKGQLIGLAQRIDRRLDSIDQRLNKYFLKTIGTYVTVLLALIASFT